MNLKESQITFTSNKEKISYLNYLPPTIDVYNVCTCENFV